MTYERLQLERTLNEAEGYMELGLAEFAVATLQRRGKLVHSSARGCYLMGEALRDMGRYREAIYPLRRSVDLIPDDVRAWLALIDALDPVTLKFTFKKLIKVDLRTFT